MMRKEYKYKKKKKLLSPGPLYSTKPACHLVKMAAAM